MLEVVEFDDFDEDEVEGGCVVEDEGGGEGEFEVVATFADDGEIDDDEDDGDDDEADDEAEEDEETRTFNDGAVDC